MKDLEQREQTSKDKTVGHYTGTADLQHPCLSVNYPSDMSK